MNDERHVSEQAKKLNLSTVSWLIVSILLMFLIGTIIWGAFQNEPTENMFSSWYGLLTTNGQNYDVARKLTTEKARWIQKFDSSYPVLWTQSCFPLSEEAIFGHKLYMEPKQMMSVRNNVGFVDPWGTFLFYDGKNGLIHCAGPDKVFGYNCQNNKEDDIIVSFRPDFYVTNVVVDESRKIIRIFFNKRLIKLNLVYKSNVWVAEGDNASHGPYIPIDRLMIENSEEEGIYVIQLAAPLEKGEVIYCRIIQGGSIIAEDKSLYPSSAIIFKDLTAEFLKRESYGLIKEVANPITYQEAKERRSTLQSKRWFLLDE